MNEARKQPQDSTDKTTPFLSVIIPAYNEEKRIPSTLDTVINYLHKQPYESELIIVDDGSRDRSVAVVQETIRDVHGARLVLNGRNRGKGFSVKNGMMNATGRFRLFSDADLSTPLEEVERFLQFHEQGYDICIGSRSLPDSNVEIHQPWYREKMGKVFGLLQRILLLRGIIDSQCGFKSFNKRAAEYLFPRQQLEGFCFDVELLYIAQKNGFTIREVPVTWRNNPDTKVGALRDSANMFLDLLRIRFHSLQGKYR